MHVSWVTSYLVFLSHHDLLFSFAQSRCNCLIVCSPDSFFLSHHTSLWPRLIGINMYLIIFLVVSGAYIPHSPDSLCLHEVGVERKKRRAYDTRISILEFSSQLDTSNLAIWLLHSPEIFVVELCGAQIWLDEPLPHAKQNGGTCSIPAITNEQTLLSIRKRYFQWSSKELAVALIIFHSIQYYWYCFCFAA